MWIFKYDDNETPYLILRQQFPVAALATLALALALVVVLAWEALVSVVAVVAPKDDEDTKP